MGQIILGLQPFERRVGVTEALGLDPHAIQACN
jgi:hypothetical protein